MKYLDLHCDALTSEGVPSVNGRSLNRGGCLLQCFAAFVPQGGFSRAESLCKNFYAFCRAESLLPVLRLSDLGEKGNALLTVEGGEALEGNAANLERLYRLGVRLLTLTWNFPNELGFPSSLAYLGSQGREQERGLTPFGREIVSEMIGLGMVVDVSHGSDRLVSDVAKICAGTPFVASHSGARESFDCPRNLGDPQIRLIAESGGVVGLDFCAAFTSDDPTPKGQMEGILRHAERLFRIGGEDVLALGSDFDGIPPNPFVKGPEDMPMFLEIFAKKFGERVAEKFAYQNALRVFSEVLK